MLLPLTQKDAVLALTFILRFYIVDGLKRG